MIIFKNFSRPLMLLLLLTPLPCELLQTQEFGNQPVPMIRICKTDLATYACVFVNILIMVIYYLASYVKIFSKFIYIYIILLS